MSPRRQRRACRAPNCPALVESGYCAAHASLATTGWSTPSSTDDLRLRGRRWMRLRLRVLSEEARCYLCDDFARDDDIVDHVVPIATGGSDERANLHRCCRPCHRLKTSRESANARQRARAPFDR